MRINMYHFNTPIRYMCASIFAPSNYFQFMNIGQTIKNFRAKNGWTQSELAERLGVSQKVISDYERQIRKPPIERLPDLAMVFNITIEELLGVKTAATSVDRNLRQNKRFTKLQKMFNQLSPADQRAVIKHVTGLLAQSK